MTDINQTNSPFEGEKVRLRSLEKSDLDDIMKHWNTYESRVGLGTVIPMSTMMEEEFIQNSHEKAKSGRGYNFAIETLETKEFLGTCGIEDIMQVNRSAAIGISIHNPENHNKGYDTDAMICLLKVGFLVLNFHRLELMVMDYNKSAIHVYEKIGFKEVGLKREAHFLQGKYHDVYMMDILAKEFKKLYPN
ncbi:MAG: GNAT family N-acetyltransferase [Candidatus Heimdallarchaeota archaeon]|nr:GNAT family N-acetyltransferase [Candidatus Heimdallarchaeota archaeon]MCG3256863.1 GNAT family N-acetyltransferase [Candidatus Heimdallarchaeota archaeon]MCK4611927.1 GNAT family N-acetyltransferase [Candidatus Heimdallarchaeota archaeon]